jgi:amidase
MADRRFRLVVASAFVPVPVLVLVLVLAALASGCTTPPVGEGEAPKPDEAQGYAIEEKTAADLAADMAAGRVSSEELVRIYLERIETIDRSGPTLRSVLAVNPRALDDAKALDAERARGAVRGPLHGVPVLVKDNIESADPLPTTAGSLALAENTTGRDAPIVARLRSAGAVILGKTNLSEWANIRSSRSTSGWSAIGGLTRNPYAVDRNSCGSSSGSGAAIAANLGALSIGTETDGSITCPAAVNGIVGLKPTVGLLSRRHIVPISHTQDTPGPMTRTVADAALMLSVMAGTDPADAATAKADEHVTDYVSALSSGPGLSGAKLGVLRFAAGYLPALDATFDHALDELRGAGATIVEIEAFPGLGPINRDELDVLLTELKADLEAYLADAPPAVKARTLDELIAFNERETAREMRFFGQELFEQAAKTKGLDAAEYRKKVASNLRLAGPEGIDRLLREHGVDALIAPTTGPAWTTDVVNGDHYLGSATTLAAVAGYPHLTVPMGHVFGLPVGLSFIGPAWSEARLLALGHAFEQRTRARVPPTFAPAIDRFEEVAAGLVSAQQPVVEAQAQAH